MINSSSIAQKINDALLLYSEKLSNWERDYLSNLYQSLINFDQVSEKQITLCAQIFGRHKLPLLLP